MRLPLILINFKCYSQATGNNALKLAKICEKVSKKFKVNFAVAPQYTDIQQISNKVSIGVFSQHIDSTDCGAFTGHVSAMAVRDAGAIGTIINHSEKKLNIDEVSKNIEMAKKYKLLSVCCATTPEEAKNIAIFKPDFIAVEPPELISSGTAVSKARPELITETVEVVGQIDFGIKVLCGAGITTGEDVRKALELGAKGMLLASAVIKSENPKKVLVEFARAIK